MTKFKLLSREHLKRIRSERGLTLIEVLLVIAIGAVVIASAVALYNVITSGNDVNETQTQVQAISTGVQKAYNASGSSYSTVATKVGIDLGVFPSGMVQGNNVYNNWNGAVTLTGAATTFTITYTNIPSASCGSLAASALGIGDSLTKVTINGTAITPPVDPASAAAACGQSDNTIIWTIR